MTDTRDSFVRLFEDRNRWRKEARELRAQPDPLLGRSPDTGTGNPSTPDSASRIQELEASLRAAREALRAAEELLNCKRAIENHPGCVEFVNAAAAEDDFLALNIQHDAAEARWEDSLAVLAGGDNAEREAKDGGRRYPASSEPSARASGSSFTLREHLDAAERLAVAIEAENPHSAIDAVTLLAHLHVMQEDWPCEPSAQERRRRSGREVWRLESDGRVLTGINSGEGFLIIANEDDVSAQSVVLSEYEVRWLANTWRGDGLEEVLRDEVAIAEQSVATLRDLRTNWRRMVDEKDDDGEPLIDNVLYWLIEDIDPVTAHKALAQLDSRRSLGRSPFTAADAASGIQAVPENQPGNEAGSEQA